MARSVAFIRRWVLSGRLWESRRNGSRAVVSSGAALKQSLLRNLMKACRDEWGSFHAVERRVGFFGHLELACQPIEEAF